MKRFINIKAEEIRLRALYRRKAMKGTLKGIPLKALRSFTGPDCAYHLYSAMGRDGDRNRD